MNGVEVKKPGGRGGGIILMIMIDTGLFPQLTNYHS